jgi:hypothetical protein
MNVGDVLDTVEQTLLSRQLSSLERFILCQSWFGRGYSQMAPDCAYSIAHIKDIGSQLWQALSKAIGQRVTKKNLFLVLKQYLFPQTVQRGVGDRVQGVERREDEDCDPTLPPSSQLTLHPSQGASNSMVSGVVSSPTPQYCSDKPVFSSPAPPAPPASLNEQPSLTEQYCPTPHTLHPTPAPQGLGDQERQRSVRDSDSEAKPCLPFPDGTPTANGTLRERASAFSVGVGRRHYEMPIKPLPTTVGSKDIKPPVTM